MKQDTMLKAGGLALALALAFAAAPVVAADDSYSDTYGAPSDTMQDSSDTQQQATPSDTTPPPSMIDESGMQTQPRGARGPIRSDEMSSPNYNDRAYRNNASAAPGERGYEGFALWQREGTNSP